jgi:hypothetical protein
MTVKKKKQLFELLMGGEVGEIVEALILIKEV